MGKEGFGILVNALLNARYDEEKAKMGFKFVVMYTKTLLLLNMIIPR